MVRDRAPATSIFEYLTHENPRLSELGPSSTQSRNEQWYTPKKVEKWKDFDFSTMKKVFGGKLWKECRASRSPGIMYPLDLLPEELLHGTDMEKKGDRILNAWTVRVVNNALDMVRKPLNPVIWVAGSRKRYGVRQVASVDGSDEPGAALEEEPEPARRRGDNQQAAQQPYSFRRNPRRTEKAQPGSTKRSRSSSSAAPGPASKKMRSFVPDGGGIRILDEEPSDDRLPSDVKGNWASREVTRRNGRYINRKGYWRDGMNLEDQARPLRQIYTYCVEANARYGFIITCGEVFLVRISPLGRATTEEEEGVSEVEVVQDWMTQHGRLEYKSIRWGMHRNAEQKSLDDFQELTVNLSLWFLFILAGNSSQIEWDYKPLEDECLACAREASGDGGSNTDGDGEGDPDQDVSSDEESKDSSDESTQKASSPPLHGHGTAEGDDEFNLNSVVASFDESEMSSALSAAVARQGKV